MCAMETRHEFRGAKLASNWQRANPVGSYALLELPEVM